VRNDAKGDLSEDFPTVIGTGIVHDAETAESYEMVMTMMIIRLAISLDVTSGRKTTVSTAPALLMCTGNTITCFITLIVKVVTWTQGWY
jgi:hypothetical protein